MMLMYILLPYQLGFRRIQNKFAWNLDQLNGISYYNDQTGENLTSVQSVSPKFGDIERRLTERLMHIKPLSNIKVLIQIRK